MVYVAGGTNDAYQQLSYKVKLKSFAEFNSLTRQAMKKARNRFRMMRQILSLVPVCNGMD